MENAKREKLLIELLFDETARIDERDDAALDLAEYDSDIAMDALIKAGSDRNFDDTVLEAVSTSIAMIWSRNKSFDRKKYNLLYDKVKRLVKMELKGFSPSYYDTCFK